MYIDVLEILVYLFDKKIWNSFLHVYLYKHLQIFR